MQKVDTWQFPLPRTHTGILQGNGKVGVMIWGQDNVLRVTINRSDFWDHRGGKPWTEGMSYAHIRRLLEAGEEQELRRLFEQGEQTPGQPERPSLLPFGRLDLIFAPDLQLTTGDLDIQTGQVIVHLQGKGQAHQVTFDLSMHHPLLHISFSDQLPAPTVRRVTAWDHIADELEAISFPPPLLFEDTHPDGAFSGWVMSRPADPPLCLGCLSQPSGLWIGVKYGTDAAAARSAVRTLVERCAAQGPESLRSDTAEWWARYWQDVPRLDIPNPRLDFLYRYGMYKFAGLSSPDCADDAHPPVPAGLQGPWIEEDGMPPWQGDYHFNINVQMCYWPAYRGNRLSHLKPLFDKIAGWLPQLRENARRFVGIDDGLMLPHAVDDRGTCMGGFWTGTVDHGCTAWVARMMYDYNRYSGDMAFLRQTAYPFMVGAMRVYEEMLERQDDRWVLPVSVSPEYRGAAIDAWGRNASFQLACIHSLCEGLLDASGVLGEPPHPIWRDIQAHLPKAALHGSPGSEQIALWEGTVLEESHRHHSHLAGICPFDMLDPADPAWDAIYERSLRHWVYQGMGLWSGWCVPWAAMIHTRFDNAEMAELLLEIWERVFVNEGYGTLHDCNMAGFTLIGTPSLLHPEIRPREKMQMDAGMGATAALLDMMLHTRRGVHHLFAGAPKRWRRVAFDGILTEGTFLVSAKRVNGTVSEVRVCSQAGGPFRLANPWSGPAEVTDNTGTVSPLYGQTIEIDLEAGQTITITPAAPAAQT